MKESDFILGLFFSDENNLVYEKIKLSGDLSEENKNNLKMISYKFLGPLFLANASVSGENWQIQFIEASLALKKGRTLDVDIIQSFFNMNSTIKSEKGIPTHLSTLIGSPHTEDTKILYDKLAKYIHPVLIQGKIVSESLLGEDFKFKDFINNELERGINLLEYSLGKSRKIYWEEQNKYYCIGIIERKIENEKPISAYLYTFDKNDAIRKFLLQFLPSYYIMAILPDFYENLIRETLVLFNRTSISPNIRNIRLRNQKKRVIYFEEYEVIDNTKMSYGVILIPEKEFGEDVQNISHYRRFLRMILDQGKPPEDIIKKINPKFSKEKWATNSEEDLNRIRDLLDNEN